MKLKNSTKFLISILLCTLCFVSSISAAKLKTPTKICKIFPDKHFAESMVRHLEKTSSNDFVTQAELDGVTQFVQKGVEGISGKILNIEGAQYLNNLYRILLPSNQVSDLSPLSKLINLKALSLPGNQISNLEPLKKLTNLEWLDLNSNQIRDLKPLKNLKNLKILNLTNNKIEKIQPILGLRSLTSLGIAVNKINDMALVSTVGGAACVVTKEGKEYFWN